MDEAFAKWVADAKAKGYTEEQIKAAAIKSGRRAEQIDAVLHPHITPETPAVTGTPTSPTPDSSLPSTTKQPQKVDKTLEIAAVVLIVLAVIGIGGYFFLTNRIDEVETISDVTSGGGDLEEQNGDGIPVENNTLLETNDSEDVESTEEKNCYVELDGFWTFAVSEVEENRCEAAKECIEKLITVIEDEFKAGGMSPDLYGPMIDEMRTQREEELADGKILCSATDPNV